ncbi:hypothetical protein A9Z42_0041130 [Trichoderma parareesei]|uniref:CCHC-type domain-containing protein n=1 Tax=Trichoderma parareesei TaxID=858221 RepID=A0A2H2ZUE9_TRIPA|nr:hypothetical protein A9Z42_0041130 [Trichoderma parareesei]
MRTAHRPNPDDFISLLSSEDEAPLTRKRKYSAAEQASAGRNRDSQGRAKRVRTSQAPGDSITGANGLKAGKHEVVEGSDIAIPGFGSHGEKKKAGGFSPDSVFLPKSPPMFTLQSISLQLPVFSPQREGTWLTRFTEWAQLLCSANRDSPSAAEITPALIRTAYKQYIDIHSRLKSNKKRAARLVAQQFKDSSLLDLIRAFRPLQNEAAQLTAAAQETLEEGLDATLAGSEIRLDSLRPLALPPQSQILSSAAAPPSLLTEQSGALYILDVAPQLPQDATMCETILASQQGSQPASQLDLLPEPQPKHLRQTQHASVKVTMSLPSAVPSGAEALRQQRLYFPSARDPFNMCLLCGAEGHVADKCTRSCQLCGKKDHWDLCCPLWQAKCGKCYRVGHSDEACWYPEEHYWVFCTYCRSAESHLSSDCMSLYRSFRPGPGTIKRVNALPVSCAKCGSKKHFHGDCRPNGMPALRCDHRFHLDNMRQYLDPASSAGPIIGTDACRVAPKAGGFRVYGQVLASPVDNVHYYSGSDDSDEGLHHLQPPTIHRQHASHRHPLAHCRHEPVRHIAPRHLHRILRHLVEAEEEDVVEVAIMVAQVANRDKVVRLLRMFRDVMRDKCKVANMCRVDKASRLAEMAGVAEMDKDIMKALIYTISRVFEKTKTAQANRMARESEAKGSDDVAEEVQMDTNEAKTDKLHKMFQLIRLIKQAKSTQVNKRARENELQDKDDVDRITKAKLNGA